MGSRDAREAIRLAAERLIAERGVRVPLRDIAVAAAQRNNSAVQYHFGSRDALIAEIVEHRSAAQEALRLRLLADAEATAPREEIRSLVELLVTPLLEVPYRQGATHHARFLEQVRNHPAVTDNVQLASGSLPAVRIVLSRLERALSELPPPLRRLRLTSLATAMFSLVADRERAIESGAAGTDLAAANVVDMLVAALTAPPSPATLHAASLANLEAARSVIAAT